MKSTKKGPFNKGNFPHARQRELGQFYTLGNPFRYRAFRRWLALFEAERLRVVEPFAGANHLVRLARDAGWTPDWECWDIDPAVPKAEGVAIRQRDTLADFPTGCRVAVTNPPYLSKSSATRRGLPFPPTKHDDLYKLALDRMLTHCEYVAAIIPETFLTADLFTERLCAVVSITERLFEETEHPVCLALFLPADRKETPDFELWHGDVFLGMHSEIAAKLSPAPACHPWSFNRIEGAIGLRAIDGTSGPSIAFVPASEIPQGSVKLSGRALTRIAGCPPGLEGPLIAAANRRLRAYRTATSDALLPAFKGLRKDGRYRRRIAFGDARQILDHALRDCRRKSA